MIFRSASCVGSMRERRGEAPSQAVRGGRRRGLARDRRPSHVRFSGVQPLYGPGRGDFGRRSGDGSSGRPAPEPAPGRGQFPQKGAPACPGGTRVANRLALGRDVAVEEARFADGSRMGYVTLPGGRSLSAELVRAGLAWPSTKRAGRLASSLVVLQTRAMSDRRGLWAGSAAPSVSRAAPALRVSAADGPPPALDADAGEIEMTPLAEEPAAGEVPVAVLGEN